MNIVWFVCTIALCVGAVWFWYHVAKRVEKNSIDPEDSPFGGFLVSCGLFLSCLLCFFGPASLFEFPRLGAILSGNDWAQGVPISFENGRPVPHPWGAWNPFWNERTTYVHKGLLHSSCRSENDTPVLVGEDWFVERRCLEVSINDPILFFSRGDMQDVRWREQGALGLINALEKELHEIVGVSQPEVQILRRVQQGEVPVQPTEDALTAALMQKFKGDLAGVSVKVVPEVRQFWVR